MAFIRSPADELTQATSDQDTIEARPAGRWVARLSLGLHERLVAQLTDLQPISFTDQLPLTFRGGGSIPNMALGSVGKPAIDDRQAKLIESMYQGTELAPQVAEGFSVRDEVYKEITAEMQEANRNAVSPKGFELAARRIGGLMKGRFNLGFVDIGGWDTHVNEGGATGYLAGRLGELGRGLAGFAEAIGPAWGDTVVVVVSEFGRTFRENGDRGTDHGHGASIGSWGSVKGGAWSASRSRSSRRACSRTATIRCSTNTARCWAACSTHLRLQPDRLQKVFPAVQPKDLALV